MFLCILVILCLIFIIGYFDPNQTKISTKNKYYNIQKIEIDSFFRNDSICIKNPNCHFTITDTQKIKQIIDEVNSLSTGKWEKIFGKEASAIIHIDLYDKSDKNFSLGLYKNYIIQKGEGYRQLGTTGFGREFDMDKTPQLKKIYSFFNEI